MTRKRIAKLNKSAIETSADVDELLPKDFLNESSLAALYAEFAEENRALAEAGMEDYARLLAEEDMK